MTDTATPPPPPPAPVRFDALPRPYREAWAFFDAYRRLGFSADVIFATTAGLDGHVQLNMELRVDGKEVVAVAGYLPTPRSTVETTWRTLATAIRDGRVPDAALARAWRQSMARAQFATLPAIVMRKGIVLPTAPRPNRQAD